MKIDQTNRSHLLQLILLLLVPTCGCGRYTTVSHEGEAKRHIAEDSHKHRATTLGGAIATLGEDAFHAEAVVDEKGILSIYVLAPDETRLHPVSKQQLTAYLKRDKQGSATPAILLPKPLKSDPEGMTTRFTLKVPAAMADCSLYVAIPGLVISGQRYMVRFEINQAATVDMPRALAKEKASLLYLTPGGLYTERDIRANERKTATAVYSQFEAKHDPNPEKGDRICPITKTKANERCSWIIGGERYYFCCPPCIDEFLQLAKANPAQIMPSDAYRQK